METPNLLAYLNIVNLGLGDGSLSEVLSDVSFTPQDPRSESWRCVGVLFPTPQDPRSKSWRCVGVPFPFNPTARSCRQEDLWGLLASQLCQRGEFQAHGRSCLKITRWIVFWGRTPEVDLWPLHVHAYLYTWTHTHTYIQTPPPHTDFYSTVVLCFWVLVLMSKILTCVKWRGKSREQPPTAFTALSISTAICLTFDWPRLNCHLLFDDKVKDQES